MPIAAGLAAETTTDQPAAAPPATDAADTTGTETERQSVGQALREIARDYVQARELLLELTLRDIRLRYKQAVMGFGWAILMPMLVVLSGIIVRYAMATFSGSTLEWVDVAGMAVKALPWAFFVGALGFAATSLVSNMNLVSKVYFPREVLPLASTLAQAVDTAVGAIALLGILLVAGIWPTVTWLWVPVLVLLLFCFTAAVALFVSCANLFYRDVKYIVQVTLTFGIFFTPVLFDATMFGPKGAPLLMLNPIAPILEGLRLSVVAGHHLLEPLVVASGSGAAVLAWSPWYLAWAALWSVGGLLASSLLFHRLEFVFAEYV